MAVVDEKAVLRTITLRIVPFMFLLYVVSFIDRTNVGFAALQMNKDIGLSPQAFGLGAGLFFIGMCPFEVPSNLMMVRFGPRRWLARIIGGWGLVTLASALISGPHGFYAMRFLLGIAEAGFFPGVLFYLTRWFPRAQRTAIVARFMISLPLAAAIGAPVSSFVLVACDGWLGIPGWRWLFIVEGAPAIVLAFVAWRVLLDGPAAAGWLAPAEREHLHAVLAAEAQQDSDAYAGHAQPGVAATLVDWRTLVITFTGVCFVIGFYGAGFWLPQIVKGFHASTLQVGLLVALPNLLGAGAMLLWAWVSRGGARASHVAWPLALACAGFVVAGCTLARPPVAMASLCVAMVALYAAMPAYWSLPTIFFSGRAAAVALAFVNAISNLGGFFGPTIIGWLRERSGDFGISIAALGVFALIGALAIMSLVPALRRSRIAAFGAALPASDDRRIA